MSDRAKEAPRTTALLFVGTLVALAAGFIAVVAQPQALEAYKVGAKWAVALVATLRVGSAATGVLGRSTRRP